MYRNGKKRQVASKLGYAASCFLKWSIFKTNIVHFSAFSFDWYMYKKRWKIFFLSHKETEGGGGQRLGDMSPESFDALPNNCSAIYIIFFVCLS